MIVPIKSISIVPGGDYGYNANAVRTDCEGNDICVHYLSAAGRMGSSCQHAFVTLDEANDFVKRVEAAGGIDPDFWVYVCRL
jgi:hypothetical protein